MICCYGRFQINFTYEFRKITLRLKWKQNRSLKTFRYMIMHGTI